MFNYLRHLLVGGFIILVLSACGSITIDWQERLANSIDPINSLQAEAYSTIYTRDYWLKQKSTNSKIWSSALKFCDTHSEYPNCNIVLGLLAK